MGNDCSNCASTVPERQIEYRLNENDVMGRGINRDQIDLAFFESRSRMSNLPQPIRPQQNQFINSVSQNQLVSQQQLYGPSKSMNSMNTNMMSYQSNLIDLNSTGALSISNTYANSPQHRTISRSVTPTRESRKQKKELKPPIQLRNGVVYSGEWVGNKKEGNGVQKWLDGAMYDGQWKNGKANGEGKFIHANGDVFQGTWENDKASGYGEFIRMNGSKYSGYWKNDQQNGHGIEEWPDGSRYQGYYKDGKKHGQGAYFWGDGSSYDGFWRENYLDGYGVYKWPDGRRYEGYWQANNMHGKGKYSWVDGRYYDGEYYQDQKNGYGVYRWADGKRYEGEWLNGLQHGRGQYVYPTGEIKQGYFENGNRTRWADGENVAVQPFLARTQLLSQPNSPIGAAGNAGSQIRNVAQMSSSMDGNFALQNQNQFNNQSNYSSTYHSVVGNNNALSNNNNYNNSSIASPIVNNPNRMVADSNQSTIFQS